MNEWFGPVLGIMQAPNLKKAIEWQNATDYGLTAGLHSLSTKECNYWLKNVEAGNLYINRPITGAVVKRQPFGGWKKSSFGSTVKAGSSYYPSIFKRYNQVKDYDILVNELEELWRLAPRATPHPAGSRHTHRAHRPSTPSPSPSSERKAHRFRGHPIRSRTETSHSDATLG